MIPLIKSLLPSNYFFLYILFVTSRNTTYYFFLLRAETAHGIMKKKTKNFFSYIFPRILLSVYILCVILICMGFPSGYLGHLVNHKSKLVCRWDKPAIQFQICFFFLVCVEISLGIFFFYIFFKSIYPLISNDNILQYHFFVILVEL